MRFPWRGHGGARGQMANRRFFSLPELNQAIRELVTQLNDRPKRGWRLARQNSAIVEKGLLF